MGHVNLGLEPEAAPEPVAVGGPVGVQVVGGPDRGMTATFVDGLLRIGRREGNDLRLTDPKVNKRHAELRLTAHGVELWDLRTRHGTWCRGLRIGAVDLGTVRRFRVGDTEIELVTLP